MPYEASALRISQRMMTVTNEPPPPVPAWRADQTDPGPRGTPWRINTTQVSNTVGRAVLLKIKSHQRAPEDKNWALGPGPARPRPSCAPPVRPGVQAQAQGLGPYYPLAFGLPATVPN